MWNNYKHHQQLKLSEIDQYCLFYFFLSSFTCQDWAILFELIRFVFILSVTRKTDSYRFSISLDYISFILLFEMILVAKLYIFVNITLIFLSKCHLFKMFSHLEDKAVHFYRDFLFFYFVLCKSFFSLFEYN